MFNKKFRYTILLSLIFHLFYSIPKIKNCCLKNDNESSINMKVKNDVTIIKTIEINKNENLNVNSNKEMIYNKTDESIGDKVDTNENNKNSMIGKNSAKSYASNIKNEYLTKSCSFMGYIYYQIKIDNNKTCVCYYNKPWYFWLRQKLKNTLIFAPLKTELYFQFCCFGENYIASERLLNVYSISKNKIFLSIL